MVLNQTDILESKMFNKAINSRTCSELSDTNVKVINRDND